MDEPFRLDSIFSCQLCRNAAKRHNNLKAYLLLFLSNLLILSPVKIPPQLHHLVLRPKSSRDPRPRAKQSQSFFLSQPVSGLNLDLGLGSPILAAIFVSMLLISGRCLNRYILNTSCKDSSSFVRPSHYPPPSHLCSVCRDESYLCKMMNYNNASSFSLSNRYYYMISTVSHYFHCSLPKVWAWLQASTAAQQSGWR